MLQEVPTLYAKGKVRVQDMIFNLPRERGKISQLRVMSVKALQRSNYLFNKKILVVSAGVSATIVFSP